MSASNPSGVASGRKDEAFKATEFNHVEDELISAQMLQRLERIERALSSMDDRVSGRLDAIEARLDAMETRLTGTRGSSHKVVAEKASVRNKLVFQLQKGWMTDDDIITFTEKEGAEKPWTTIGIRSFVKKMRTQLGIVVDTEEQGGVRRYRIAK